MALAKPRMNGDKISGDKKERNQRTYCKIYKYRVEEDQNKWKQEKPNYKITKIKLEKQRNMNCNSRRRRKGSILQQKQGKKS